MKYGVNKEILLITAGTVWIIAGANILRIGIVTWLNNSEGWMFKIGEATIVFLLFFVLIFKRLYYKHTQRIERKKGWRTRSQPIPQRMRKQKSCFITKKEKLPAKGAFPF